MTDNHDVTKAVAYLRVSTDKQRDRGAGLDVQRHKVETYAAEHGLELVDVVQEAASGMAKTGELFSWEHRPALLDLIERAKRGEYQLLLVSTFDRLSRDHVTLVAVERLLAQHGVEVRSASENNGDGPEAALLRGTQATVAEYEGALIRARLQAGKAARRRQGLNADGAPPYGYAADHGRLVVVPERAAVVERIFKAIRRGESAASIARALTDEGVATPRSGAKWSTTAILAIVRNRSYRGERHGGKATHEPIIDVRLWNAANAAVKARSEARRRS